MSAFRPQPLSLRPKTHQFSKVKAPLPQEMAVRHSLGTYQGLQGRAPGQTSCFARGLSWADYLPRAFSPVLGWSLASETKKHQKRHTFRLGLWDQGQNQHARSFILHSTNVRGSHMSQSIDKGHVLQILGISCLLLYIEPLLCPLHVPGAAHQVASTPAQGPDSVQVTQHMTHSLGAACSDLTSSRMYTV